MNSSSLSPLFGLHRQFHIAILLIFSGLTISFFPTCAPAAVFEEVYLTLSRKTGPRLYNIALDKIGVYVDKTVATEEVASLSDEFDIDGIRSYSGGFHIAELRESTDRKSLNTLARALSKQSKVKLAGLVLYPDGYDKPILLTDMIIVVFRGNLSNPEVQNFAKSLGLVAIKSNSLVTRQWLFRLDPETKKDALEIVKVIGQRHDDIVEFAMPNFAFKLVPLQSVPIDSLFDNQWHHRNLGQANGTFDADVDSEMAWSLSRGKKNTVIALFDTGFSLNHPDLSENYWRNLGEQGTDPSGAQKESNDCDDDGNGYDDDFHGYDFSVCFLGTCPKNSPDNTGRCAGALEDWGGITEAEHGTSVAGVAAGIGNNGSGISGICPKCSLMLLQIDFELATEWSIEEAITYAGNMNADILNNSWSYEPLDVVPETVINVIDATAAKGTIIFWAMDNRKSDDCAGNSWELYTNPNVIPVSASSNWDRKVTESGYGDCLGILAPSYGGLGPNPNPDPEDQNQIGYEYTGTLNMATTDLEGPTGYNNTLVPASGPRYDMSYCDDGSDTNERDYTLCFSGTSAATPVAAGIGGLVKSVRSSINVMTMKRLLQDTADKIEPGLADYDETSGKSSVTPPTHGYGRINAYEAVRVVAPVKKYGASGLGGTDIFIRDNELDWGNTAQEIENGPSWRGGSNVLMGKDRGIIGHYQSVDIKVDAPPHEPIAPSNPQDFDSFPHENPISGALNKVYVKVRNRGPDPASNVKVKLYWALAGTSLPPLPTDFWSNNPTQPSEWNSLGTKTITTVGYSGATAVGTGADQSKIVSFDFIGPTLDPSIEKFRHHCLFAYIDSPDDPVKESRLIPDIVTPTNNNVTHRNLSVQDASTTGAGGWLMVRNPFPWPINTRISVVKPKLWKVSLSRFGDSKPFRLQGGESIPIKVKISWGEVEETGLVEVRQELRHKETYHPFGGFVYSFSAK